MSLLRPPLYVDQLLPTVPTFDNRTHLMSTNASLPGLGSKTESEPRPSSLSIRVSWMARRGRPGLPSILRRMWPVWSRAGNVVRGCVHAHLHCYRSGRTIRSSRISDALRSPISLRCPKDIRSTRTCTYPDRVFAASASDSRGSTSASPLDRRQSHPACRPGRSLHSKTQEYPRLGVVQASRYDCWCRHSTCGRRIVGRGSGAD